MVLVVGTVTAVLASDRDHGPADGGRHAVGKWKLVLDDDFASGLRYLLDHDRWREAGLAAWRYVSSTFATAPAIEGHLEVYRSLLARRG